MRPVEETGFPEQSRKHRILMRKCFDRSNKPLANIVHTAEKKVLRSHSQQERLERLMDKIQLDRNQKLREKMELLWGPSTSQGLKEKVEEKRLFRKKQNNLQ